MLEKFDFEDLFVLDLANNHQGSLDHGLAIIREVGEVVRGHDVRAALKFQFRELDSFVHPRHRDGSDNRHVPRFLSTRLSADDFRSLADEVLRQSLITMSTPFDEPSVDLIEELDIRVIKIASCSITDWPLIQRVAEVGRPVVFSTGGATLEEIDDLVSFFDHRRVHFAIMHCVSIYPTPAEALQLNQIDLLRRRFPSKVIGFSTHEDPDDVDPVVMAVGKGARMFERHVGLETDEISLNAYSSTPDQLDRWLGGHAKAKAMAGVRESRPQATEVERQALASLARGVFSTSRLKPGQTIRRDQVYFDMPVEDEQLTAGDWRQGIEVTATVGPDDPLALADLVMPEGRPAQRIYAALHRVRAIMNEARIAVPLDFKMELSHHYGMEHFDEVGAVLIDCVNREYCKKLVIQVPGQKHPSHYHKMKEETFQVLHGVLKLGLDDRRKTLYPGETVLVQQGVWHEFSTESGVVFEEISTTHHNNDSFYEDKAINRMKRSERKTVVDHWGRHQI